MDLNQQGCHFCKEIDLPAQHAVATCHWQSLANMLLQQISRLDCVASDQVRTTFMYNHDAGSSQDNGHFTM